MTELLTMAMRRNWAGASRVPALLGTLLALASLPALAQLAPAPEAETGRTTRALGLATRHMVAAANPLAAAAGRDILRVGGGAVDAAVAVQLVLNLVEPQSSGIGGGAFLLHWDARRRSLVALDGRETAPAAARPDRFVLPDGRPWPFQQAVVGGRAVGVPGVMRLLEEAHRRFGRLPWPRLFEPAIRLAEEGFAVSPRLAGLLARETALQQDPRGRALYFDEAGAPRPAGFVLRNLAFAATLRTLAERGASAFYEGPIAEDVVARVTQHPSNPGDMTAADLAAYRVAERPPLCGRYRAFTICGMGPPSSGGVAVLQMLAFIEDRDLGRAPNADAAHWIAEAGRLAFADRNLYVADPDFVAVPVRGLLDPDYLRTRAALMGERSMGVAQPGVPPFARRGGLAPSLAVEDGTSHVSIVDAQGDAVALTTTIESGFGARVVTEAGFLLNNELTDFDFRPEREGLPVVNRVEGGKRPRSSMAPTIVFDAHGRLHAVLGSPGGSQIILYVVKTLVAMLDWGLDPQSAVDLANFGSRNGPTELEAGSEAQAWRPALEARGHRVTLLPMTSGAQAILVTPRGFEGGADGRREGVAVGD